MHHAIAPEPLPELAAGILRPLVRMKHHPMRASTLLPGMLQSLYHQVRVSVVWHRPADHAAGAQVQYHSQITPALPGLDVGDITAPDLIRLLHIKLPV